MLPYFHVMIFLNLKLHYHIYEINILNYLKYALMCTCVLVMQISTCKYAYRLKWNQGAELNEISWSI